MKSSGIENLKQSMACLRRLGTSQREQEAALAKRHYWGLQYEELAPWEMDLPMRQRKPPVRWRITKHIVDTVTGYLFGEGKKPIWEAEKQDPEVKQVLQDLVARSGVEWVYSELGRLACLTGTVALAFFAFNDDRIDVEVIQQTESSYPTFGYQNRTLAVQRNIPFDDLLQLDEYWHSIQADPESGQEVVLMHRRLWTLDETVMFQPIDVSTGRQLDNLQLQKLRWVKDEAASIVHNLGFVPVAWIRLVEITGEVDGAPLLGKAEFDIENEINYTLSQAGRAVHYMSEPKTVFTDVANLSDDDIRTGASQSWRLKSSNITGGPAAKVELLEMNGSGQEAAMEYVDRLRWSLYQVARVVEHDPERFAGAMSGTALKLLLAPMIAMINDLRPQFEKGIGRLLSKMLKFKGYSDVDVIATWPEIVPLTSVDLIQLSTAMNNLMDAQLITKRTALSILAPYFGIDDVDDYMTQLVLDSASTVRFGSTPDLFDIKMKSP